MNSIFHTSILTLFFAVIAHGQDSKEKPVSPPAMVSVLAIGGVSDNVANWKDNAVFSFEATDPEAAPPMDLYLEQIVEKKKAYKPLPLALNMATPMIPLPSGQPMMLFRQKVEPASGGAAAGQQSASYLPAMSLPVGSLPVSLIVMWRDKANPKWIKPNIATFDVGEAAFPAGQVCFLNLTGAQVRVTLMKENRILEPHDKWIVLPTKAANGVTPYKLEVILKDKVLPVAMTSLTKLPENRSMIAVYAVPNGKVESAEILIPKAVLPTPPPSRPTGTENGGTPVQTTTNR